MNRNQHIFFGSPSEMKRKGQEILRYFLYKKNEKNDKYVVFFDIDDTLLNTKKNMKPIQPIFDLYHTCRSLGIKTVIITARPDAIYNRKYTENELIDHGLSYDLLYMYPSYLPVTYEYIYEFKKKCREDALEVLNANPIFSVGDREWDMGKYGGIGLLVESV